MADKKEYVLTCNNSGELLGAFTGETELHAIAAHFNDIGYSCEVQGSAIVYVDVDSALSCSAADVSVREMVLYSIDVDTTSQAITVTYDKDAERCGICIDTDIDDIKAALTKAGVALWVISFDMDRSDPKDVCEGSCESGYCLRYEVM